MLFGGSQADGPPRLDARTPFRQLRTWWDRWLDAYTYRQSTAGAWDTYARVHRLRRLLGHDASRLGDEWSRPDLAGLDIEQDQFVKYLDEDVFQPFLQPVDVGLEIGAGGGRFTEMLLPKCKRLIATDTSPAMLELVRARFPSEVAPGLECLRLDGRGLHPIADQTVDLVFSFGVFVHLEPWDFFNYLRESHRILRPGGRAIVQHPDTFSDHGWRQFSEVDLPGQLGKHKLFGSFNVMTPELMEAFVSRAGLILVRCDTSAVQGVGISFIERRG